MQHMAHPDSPTWDTVLCLAPMTFSATSVEHDVARSERGLEAGRLVCRQVQATEGSTIVAERSWSFSNKREIQILHSTNVSFHTLEDLNRVSPSGHELGKPKKRHPETHFPLSQRNLWQPVS